jgi:hypothetical protein
MTENAFYVIYAQGTLTEIEEKNAERGPGAPEMA